MDKVILEKWLTAGYMDKRVLHETTDGTPQGGVISPALANYSLAMDLSDYLKDKSQREEPSSPLEIYVPM